MTVQLWLDDARPAPAGWQHAKTAAEAMALVAIAEAAGEAVADMALDHDLGNLPGSLTAAPTGMQFLEWVAKTRRWPLAAPTCHSANPDGRRAMEALVARGFPPLPTEGLEVHRNAWGGVTPAPHRHCPDPACCRCACPACFQEWRAASRPFDADCLVHHHRS